MQSLRDLYRYHRTFKPAAAALAAARADLAAGQKRYGKEKPFANPVFESFGEKHCRWIERPESFFRLVGFADEVAKRNDYHRSGIDHKGWYVDQEFQGETARGVVYRMVGKDGHARYLPGIADPYGNDAAIISFDEIFDGDKIESSWDDDKPARDAAYRADDMARIYAERESEYQEQARAGMTWNDLAEQVANYRRQALALLAEMKRARKSALVNYPTICETLRRQILNLVDDIREAREQRAKLFDDYGNTVGFKDV